MKKARHLLIPLAVLLLALATISAGATRQSEGTRFTSMEILIDSGAEALAAWQLEWSDPSDRASLVGIEGGEHDAFAEPARYDPRALAGGRVVLAAFSLDEELPRGRTRVARLHLEVRGDDPVTGECKLVAVANAAGHEIEAKALVLTGE